MASSVPRFREKAQVLDEAALDRALTRIAHEILEKNGGASEVAFVGLRTRGVTLAHRLAAKIAQIDGAALPVGTLDITLYRDDLGLRGAPLIRGTDIPFSIKNKRSEEHTSELQSRLHLVCRLLLEKKKQKA